MKPPKKFKFARSACPNVFESAHRLLEDFFAEVDRVVKEAQH